MSITFPSQEAILSMPEREVKFPPETWLNAVDQAGRNLDRAAFSNAQWETEIKSIEPDFLTKHRVHPADFCYNRINADGNSFRYPLFEYSGRNSYLYLGPDFPFEGEVRWQPQGRSELIVGRWMQGKCYLRYDPRR